MSLVKYKINCTGYAFFFSSSKGIGLIIFLYSFDVCTLFISGFEVMQVRFKPSGEMPRSNFVK